jgi:hypothetical protein
MSIYDEQREADLADYLAEVEADDVDNVDDDDFGGDDWVPGCDSVASYCEGPYDPMTDW